MMDSVTSSPRRAVVKSFLLMNITGRHLQTQTEVQGRLGGHGWLGEVLVSRSCKESILKSSPQTDAITGTKVLSG